MTLLDDQPCVGAHDLLHSKIPFFLRRISCSRVYMQVTSSVIRNGRPIQKHTSGNISCGGGEDKSHAPTNQGCKKIRSKKGTGFL